MNGIIYRYVAVPSKFNWSPHGRGCVSGIWLVAFIVVGGVVGRVVGIGHVGVSVRRFILVLDIIVRSGNSFVGYYSPWVGVPRFSVLLVYHIGIRKNSGIGRHSDGAASSWTDAGADNGGCVAVTGRNSISVGWK